MSNIKISIIIPVYNTDEEYLRTCINSILDQALKEIEVIAVNDGSTNNAPAVLSSLSKKDERLRVISQENMGTSVARNTGLDAANGQYILFVDGDDFLEDGILKTIYEENLKQDKDILFFGYATNYTNRQIRRVLDDPDPGLWKRDVLEMAVLEGDVRLGSVEVGAPWGKLIKREVIEENRVRYTPGLVKGQDTVFVLDLIEHCNSFAYLPVLGYHYRISGASVSHRYNENIVSIMEKTLGAYESFVSRYQKGGLFERAVAKKYYRVLTGEYLTLKYLNPSNTASEEERIREYSKLCEGEKYKKAVSVMGETAKRGGFFDKAIYRAFRKNDLKGVFRIKKTEMFIRSLIIKNYK
ncbi:MAG: glycosyltransferase [Lachnospiraceae bacterium]|nr:glycosyltransferase [Lachnospiraceae bacterium]